MMFFAILILNQQITWSDKNFDIDMTNRIYVIGCFCYESCTHNICFRCKIFYSFDFLRF